MPFPARTGILKAVVTQLIALEANLHSSEAILMSGNHAFRTSKQNIRRKMSCLFGHAVWHIAYIPVRARF